MSCDETSTIFVSRGGDKTIVFIFSVLCSSTVQHHQVYCLMWPMDKPTEQYDTLRSFRTFINLLDTTLFSVMTASSEGVLNYAPQAAAEASFQTVHILHNLRCFCRLTYFVFHHNSRYNGRTEIFGLSWADETQQNKARKLIKSRRPAMNYATSPPHILCLESLKKKWKRFNSGNTWGMQPISFKLGWRICWGHQQQKRHHCWCLSEEELTFCERLKFLYRIGGRHDPYNTALSNRAGLWHYRIQFIRVDCPRN